MSASASAVAGVASAWQVAGVADFNGDGRDDIILQRTSDGMIAVWAMNGAAVTSASFAGAADPETRSVRGVGDYNGDGRDDILWQKEANGLVYVWLMNGGSVAASGAIAGVGPEWGLI